MTFWLIPKAAGLSVRTSRFVCDIGNVSYRGKSKVRHIHSLWLSSIDLSRERIAVKTELDIKLQAFVSLLKLNHDTKSAGCKLVIS